MESKCPVCGSSCSRTKIKSFNTFVPSHIEWSCSKCKKAPVFRTKKSWNQYVAATELYNALDCGALRELLGEIEDCGSDRLWALAKTWMEMRDEALKKARGES